MPGEPGNSGPRGRDVSDFLIIKDVTFCQNEQICVVLH